MKVVPVKELEIVLKALGNRRRLNIISFLKNKKEATVGQIAEAITLSFKSTSRHLRILYSAEILEKEQRGIEVHYEISHRPGALLQMIMRML